MFISERQLTEELRANGFNTGSKSTYDPFDHIVKATYTPGQPIDPELNELLRFIADQNKDESTSVIMHT
jgi:hypothetical protein